MCHTESDMGARLFLYWTHVDNGRRLASNPHEGRIKTSHAGAGETNYMIGRRVSGITREYRDYRSIPPTRAKQSLDAHTDRA
jgi:hypothetical protein